MGDRSGCARRELEYVGDVEVGAGDGDRAGDA